MINCENTIGDWDSCCMENCNFPECVKDYINEDED